MSRLVLIDVVSGGEQLPIDILSDSTDAAALSPDGLHVLAGSYEGRLWWIDVTGVETPVPLIELPVTDSFTAVAIDESGRLLAGGTGLGEICVYDVVGRQNIELETAETLAAVSHLSFARDGSLLVGGHRDGQLSVWNVPSKKLVRKLARHSGHNGVPKGAKFLPNNQRIISAGLDDTVRIWDIESGRESWRGDFNLLGVNALAVSRDGRLAAWAGNNRRILVWDLEQGHRRFQIDTTASAVFDLSFSPDGTILAAAGSEGTVPFYDMQTGMEIRRIAPRT